MRMNEREYQDYLHRSTGSSVRSNNSKTKILRPAIQKISTIQKISSNMLFTGRFKISVEIFGKSRADGDNILKGVLDSLNKTAYQDDRQCREGRFVFKSDD